MAQKDPTSFEILPSRALERYPIPGSDERAKQLSCQGTYPISK